MIGNNILIFIIGFLIGAIVGEGSIIKRLIEMKREEEKGKG